MHPDQIEWLTEARAIIAQMRADMEAVPDNNQELWMPWCRHMEALTDAQLLEWRRTGNADVDLFGPETKLGQTQRRLWAAVDLEAYGKTEGRA